MITARCGFIDDKWTTEFSLRQYCQDAPYENPPADDGQWDPHQNNWKQQWPASEEADVVTPEKAFNAPQPTTLTVPPALERRTSKMVPADTVPLYFFLPPCRVCSRPI